MNLKLTFLLSVLLASFICKSETFIDSAIVVNGSNRAVLFCLPDNYNADTEYPLIIGIHYCGGTPGEYRNKLKRLSDSLEVIVACPDYNSSQIPIADTNMFQILTDTANSIFNINHDEIYLTGMSCNAEYILREGLKCSFPFKGVFPWAPWVDSSSPTRYNYDTDIPTVISIGTLDTKIKTTIQIYDSLKNHGADVNFIIVPRVGHTLNFGEFTQTMLKSLDYINNKSDISIETINDITLVGEETKEIVFTVNNSNNTEVELTAFSSHPSNLPSAEIEPTTNANEYKLLLEPVNSATTVCIIIELIEKESRAISQSTFMVHLEKTVSAQTLNINELKIYPNPVKNILFIENLNENSAVQIFDLTGKMVYNAVASSSKVEIPFGFDKGMYIVKVQYGTLERAMIICKED